jgi:hypothetical protein
MPEAIQKPAVVKDMVVDVIDGVRLYSRRTTENAFTLNASSGDQPLIERMAQTLHRQGYAVKRETFILDARTHYDLEAAWVGDGEPPYPKPE